MHIQVTVLYASHVVKVSHCNAYDLFSDTTWLSSGLLNSDENNVIF